LFLVHYLSALAGYTDCEELKHGRSTISMSKNYFSLPSFIENIRCRSEI